MIGLALFLIAPFVLVIIHTEADELALLKANGVVAEGEIISHDSRENSRTSRKGRDRSTTSYLLEVRFDVMARTPYADWAKGQNWPARAFPRCRRRPLRSRSPNRRPAPSVRARRSPSCRVIRTL